MKEVRDRQPSFSAQTRFSKSRICPHRVSIRGNWKKSIFACFFCVENDGGVQKVTVILGTEEEKNFCVFERRYFYSTA